MAIMSQYGPSSKVYQDAIRAGTQYSPWSPFSGSSLSASDLSPMVNRPSMQSKPAQYTGLPNYQQPPPKPQSPTSLYQNLVKPNPAFGQMTLPGGGNYRGLGVPGNKPIPAVGALKNLGLLTEQQMSGIGSFTRFGPGGSLQDQYSRIGATLGIPVDQVQGVLWQAQNLAPWQAPKKPGGPQYTIGKGGNLMQQPQTQTTTTTRFPANAYELMLQNQASRGVNPYAGVAMPEMQAYAGLPSYTNNTARMWGS